jgi:Mn-containing catalase
MFYHDGGKLQYEVKVTRPNPVFARALQQAIGGVEGEIRVCLQYLFQAFGARGPDKKYRDMLLNTGTEEIAHIEMLATAVALNLEGAPTQMEEAAKDPIIFAKLGGMNFRHFLSTTLCALPVNCEGVPFDCSHVYASGNLAADMLANVTAESTGRMLACQLYKLTNDPGMKDMLSFLIARDTMHQNQWLAAWQELGGPKNHPIPDTFPTDKELQEVSYQFFYTGKDDAVPKTPNPATQGKSFDGRGEFKPVDWKPRGAVPNLGMASPKASAQAAQTEGQAKKK